MVHLIKACWLLRGACKPMQQLWFVALARPFFMRRFGNFNLELRYCDILQTCEMHLLDVLIDDCRYKSSSFAFFRLFSVVSSRVGSKMKQPSIVTHFKLQFACFRKHRLLRVAMGLAINRQMVKKLTVRTNKNLILNAQIIGLIGLFKYGRNCIL